METTRNGATSFGGGNRPFFGHGVSPFPFFINPPDTRDAAYYQFCREGSIEECHQLVIGTDPPSLCVDTPNRACCSPDNVSLCGILRTLRPSKCPTISRTLTRFPSARPKKSITALTPLSPPSTKLSVTAVLALCSLSPSVWHAALWK